MIPPKKEQTLTMTRFSRCAILTLALGLFSGAPAWAQGFSGSYLAARSAMIDNDFDAAAQYYARALVRDPGNTDIMQNAIMALVGRGKIDRAIAVARRLQGNSENEVVANMLVMADLVNKGEYGAAREQLDNGEGIGPLVDGLMLAWMQVGQGDMSSALTTFDEVSQKPGLQAFGLYHKALALALAGDLEGADEILSGKTGAEIPNTRRGIIAHAEILSQLERNTDALARIDEVFGAEPDPSLTAIRQNLLAGENLPLNSISDPKEGVAEVFYSVAGALAAEIDQDRGLGRMVLVYARMASHLRPDHVDAILLAAGLLENMEQYELATAAYDQISRDDPSFFAAEFGRAQALGDSGNPDGKIEVLKQLSETFADQAEVHTTLGDSYRQQSQFEEAVASYDRAISLLNDNGEAGWVPYYTRGITLERLDNWDAAEADFRKALELNPDQPNVLNYLGYSFVELQINLDEALDMIERAVAARPNDGFITDSLGWVLYRLGRYEEAVGHMELAAELKPVDPIINDHLGDVYWAVGRRREAEFQWSRAMSFEPEEEDETRIRRKLEVGLDVVLKEEGADPISLANDG